MKRIAFLIMTTLTLSSAFGAEYAAKQLFAERQAHNDLHVDNTNVTVHEKNMGNGVHCYYVVKSLRGTASQDSAKANPAISCVKVD